jgi:hypothetical protein
VLSHENIVNVHSSVQSTYQPLTVRQSYDNAGILSNNADGNTITVVTHNARARRAQNSSAIAGEIKSSSVGISEIVENVVSPDTELCETSLIGTQDGGNGFARFGQHSVSNNGGVQRTLNESPVSEEEHTITTVTQHESQNDMQANLV